MRQLILLVTILMPLTACKPAVGSKAWCEDMEEKAKGDWTVNEAADYVQHCLVRSDR
jgi:hypothetical protein